MCIDVPLCCGDLVRQFHSSKCDRIEQQIQLVTSCFKLDILLAEIERRFIMQVYNNLVAVHVCPKFAGNITARRRTIVGRH